MTHEQYKEQVNQISQDMAKKWIGSVVKRFPRLAPSDFNPDLSYYKVKLEDTCARISYDSIKNTGLSEFTIDYSYLDENGEGYMDLCRKEREFELANNVFERMGENQHLFRIISIEENINRFIRMFLRLSIIEEYNDNSYNVTAQKNAEPLHWYKEPEISFCSRPNERQESIEELEMDLLYSVLKYYSMWKDRKLTDKQRNDIKETGKSYKKMASNMMYYAMILHNSKLNPHVSFDISDYETVACLVKKIALDIENMASDETTCNFAHPKSFEETVDFITKNNRNSYEKLEEDYQNGKGLPIGTTVYRAGEESDNWKIVKTSVNISNEVHVSMSLNTDYFLNKDDAEKETKYRLKLARRKQFEQARKDSILSDVELLQYSFCDLFDEDKEFLQCWYPKLLSQMKQLTS